MERRSRPCSTHPHDSTQGRAWSAPRARRGWRVARMELHPKSLCASPPQLSPLPDVPLWPLTAGQALLSSPGFQGSPPCRGGGRVPCGDFPAGREKLPQHLPCPARGSHRNKCPVCAGGREGAVGAMEARTPRLSCRAGPVPLLSTAQPARCQRLQQGPGDHSSG